MITDLTDRRPTPTDEPRILGFTGDELRRARRMRSEDRMKKYIKHVQTYAHRRWCFVNSDGIYVLATTARLMGLLDIEEIPSSYWLERYAHMHTNGRPGVHLYIPPGAAPGRGPLGFWPTPKESADHGLKRLIDKRYLMLSNWRGYYHEKPRDKEIIIPQGMLDAPGWRDFLRLHREWHRWAAAEAAEYGQRWK